VLHTGDPHAIELAFATLAERKIAALLIHETDGGEKQFLEYGLTLRPEKINFEAYKKEHTDLLKRLGGYRDRPQEE
jgi:hypothetical protein